MESLSLSEAIRLVPQEVSPTIPSNVSPRPACANVVPQADRGRPAARRHAVARGVRNRPQRSTRALRAPAITKIPRPAAQIATISREKPVGFEQSAGPKPRALEAAWRAFPVEEIGRRFPSMAR